MDSRIETLLNALVNDGALPEDYEPMSRNEAYLLALLQKGIADKEEILRQIQKASDVMIVNITKSDDGKFTADKTSGEILEAYNAGKVVYAKLANATLLSLTTIVSGNHYGYIEFDNTHEHISTLGYVVRIDEVDNVEVYKYSEGFKFNNLKTTDKTITGAINELNSTKLATPGTAEVGQTIVVKAVDGNGKPTEWEAVDSQADWSQNDPTAPDYVKNRTHYMTDVEGDAIFDETLEFSASDDALYYYGSETYTDRVVLKLILDAKYNVYWDGTLYEGLVCSGNDIETYIGSSIDELRNEDTVPKYPFNITTVYRMGENHVSVATSENLSSHTVKITKITQEPKKLDEKFIPDSIARVEGDAMIIKSSTEGSTKKFKLTVDDTGAITTTEVTE